MISTNSSNTPATNEDAPTTGVLFSGGLDSSILAAHLLATGHQVQPFYVRSGLRWEAAELAAATDYLRAMRTPALRPLVILEVPVNDLYGDHWSVSSRAAPSAHSADEDVYLPGRNALLVVKSAIWCKLNHVPRLALATLGTSPFADAASGFFEPLQTALNCGDEHPLQISRPFSHFDKQAVMTLGSPFPLALTFSCLAPVGSRHCGACNKCGERQAAFRSVQRLDPTPYAQAPVTTISAS